MFSFIFEEILCYLLGPVFFYTGEIVLFIVTCGQHKVDFHYYKKSGRGRGISTSHRIGSLVIGIALLWALFLLVD